MKVEIKDPPRIFNASKDGEITSIKDCASINLSPGEQVTFFTADGKETDFCRTGWGYYATPSINGRLERFHFKTALVCNNQAQYFIMLVEDEKIDLFNEFLEKYDEKLVCWLNDDNLGKINSICTI